MCYIQLKIKKLIYKTLGWKDEQISQKEAFERRVYSFECATNVETQLYLLQQGAYYKSYMTDLVKT
jgi:hypothetical protein